MKVILVDSRHESKILGKLPEIVLPRIGEKINLGYAPASYITDIIYDYDNQTILVCVDGFIF